MTKERSLAIEMWEHIVAVLENGAPDKCYSLIIASIKEDFCSTHNLQWKHSCWFCQYVRHDRRSNLPSREHISPRYDGCQPCPLYKEKVDILKDDECGCTDEKKTLWKQVIDEGNVYAARRILELLKGE